MQQLQKKVGEANGLASLALYDFAFTVGDLGASVEWYTRVLNFTLISESTFDIPGNHASVAIMHGAGIKLELLHIPGGKRIEELFAPVPLHLVVIGNKAVVFQVEDIKIASEELAAKGANFLWRERYLAGDKMLCSMIEDIDGNKINIFQKNTTV
ncbi:MAG TPA: VOC family protein [Chitinophagaceae bacterium]|nr:VOC family protein [Chitinophagaceae bacterium]